MLRNPQETVPVWHDPFADLTPTSPPRDAEVCVIGAGISGLSAAYLLQREGVDVQVLEARTPGAGETGRTTAHLSAVLDDRLSELERLFGRDGARLAVRSHQAAIDEIDRITHEESIDCDFERVDGYLMATDSEQQRVLAAEQAAVRWAGFPDVEPVRSLQYDGFRFTGPGLRFPGQGMFHPEKYLRGLARAFLRRGGRIAGNARATKVNGGRDASVVLADGSRVHARHIVVATNTPFSDRVRMHTKQHAYRSYAIAFAFPRESLRSILLWDLADPYHYVRTARAGDRHVLIIGGEDHKTGQRNDATARYQALEAWSRAHVEGLGDVTHRWSGQILEPVDGLAFIGRNPLDQDNVYIATGDSGHGMTHGTLAGVIIRDLVLGKANEFAALYDPSRKNLHAARTYLGENANMVGHMIRDWARGGEVGDRNEIAAGEGALLREGVAPLAVYRDESGGLHEYSAVCPHLGCVVQWNAGEKSWDCPCHGSRFAIDGSVLNGPAKAPLSPASERPLRRRQAR